MLQAAGITEAAPGLGQQQQGRFKAEACIRSAAQGAAVCRPPARPSPPEQPPRVHRSITQQHTSQALHMRPHSSVHTTQHACRSQKQAQLFHDSDLATQGHHRRRTEDGDSAKQRRGGCAGAQLLYGLQPPLSQSTPPTQEKELRKTAGRRAAKEGP